jgi:CubicO group peptidase (beta-lactamase class C family)
VVSDQITVRHLLSHSSGLGDATIVYGRTDEAALHDYVAALTPASAFAPPGTVFSYSNPGFNAVGRIIEVVTGMEYADYMAERVFPALGMTRSTFDRERALAEGLALGHFPSPEGPVAVERDADYAAEFPSGYAFSSIEEMSRLARFLLSDGLLEGEQILSPATVQAMKTPAIWVDSLGSGYGLGVALGTTARKATFGHTGNIPGYSAILVAVPDHELAVIVLANRNVYNLSPILEAAIALFVEPVSMPPMQEITLDTATLAEYAGRYQMMHVFESDESMIVTIAARDGTLTADVPGVAFGFTLELRPLGNDLFNVYEPQMTTPATQIAFSRDTTGMIRYMNLSSRALLRVQE